MKKKIIIRKTDEGEIEPLRRRIDITITIVISLMALLISRLWYLQIHKGAEYAKLSENNRVRTRFIAAPRGAVLDVNGDKIVANQPCFNIVWVKEDAPNPDEVIRRLARILNEDINVLLDHIRAAADNPGYMPIRMKENIDWKTLVAVENSHFDLPGISIEVVPNREYLRKNLASHLIGYLGEVDQQELSNSQWTTYHPGDLIGKMGVEKVYERYLRGKKGLRYIEVDVHGNLQQLIGEELPFPGNDIHLTIDLDMQSVAEEAMAEKSGAVVAMEVNTGKILVLGSFPGLKLEDFIGGITTKTWNDLLKNPLTPLINKAIQGQYPPGSTYKIITALAGLSEGVINTKTTYFCGGSLYFGNRSYGCWKKGGHGSVSIHEALIQSCDVFFYQVGQRVGVDALAKHARSLGLGELTGIELENEKPGVIPTSAWKLKRFKVPWQDGETLSIAIGQGFDLVTPLQLCRATAALANGGTLYKPQFIEKIVGGDGKSIQTFAPVVDGQLHGSAKHLELIRTALISVVNERRGTAWAARLPEVSIAGKTGTAQVVLLSKFKDYKDSGNKIPYEAQDHAWFTCFAPAEKPEIAVSVLVEHGGHGGSAAGPIARDVTKKYFEKRHGLTFAKVPSPVPVKEAADVPVR